jgi:hypothetical protein
MAKIIADEYSLSKNQAYKMILESGNKGWEMLWYRSKNQHRHSAVGEESHIFLFKSKDQKMRFFGLQPQDDTEKTSLQNFGTVSLTSYL